MKLIRKSTAFVLTFLMLLSTLPISAFTVKSENDVVQNDVVDYNLGNLKISVGSDEEQLEAGTIQKLFEANGNFTIELEPNAFFPYEVQFTCGGETREEWFMTPEDSVVIGGHVFSVHSEQTDSTVPTQIGLWVGDEYIPAYPEKKDFTTGPKPKSMMPLTEKHFNLDMTGYLPEELKVVSVSTIFGGLTDGETTGTENVAAWAKWYYYDENGDYVSSNDNYTVLQSGDRVDLSDYNPWGDSDWFDLELIIGTADQLNLSNMRYIVRVSVDGPSSLLHFSAATENRDPIEIYYCSTNTIWAMPGDGRPPRMCNVYYLGVNKEDWQSGQKAYVGIFNSALDSRYYVNVLNGYYELSDFTPFDLIDKVNDPVYDITEEIWTDDLTASGYLRDYGYEVFGGKAITVLFFSSRAITNDTTIIAMPMIVRMEEARMSLGSSMVYADSGSTYRDNIHYSETYQRNNNPYGTFIFYLDEGYSASDTYYFNLVMHDETGEAPDNYGLEFVKKAVVGYYETEDDIPAGATDIKTQLFSNAGRTGGGYGADYSNGVVFTVVDVKGGIHWLALQTKAYEEYQSSTGGLPGNPEPASSDTYFRMNRADEGVARSGYINSYTMPYEADSYYYNGYQTVLLLNYENSTYSPVTDATIIPSFYQGNKVEVYAGHDGASGTKQVSGETAIPFESGKAIQYSVAAENGTDLKNYWVTFLTQQSGPKLFVNATNDESHYVTVNEGTPQEETIPQREVFLTDEFDNHHDVFFANIGDEAITGLYVRLENAQNVALDEYWTVGATTTLSAFTTTSTSTSYGELANTAKIRLVPAKDPMTGQKLSGPISGTLVIGYTGGDGEEIRINLTGTAGTPKITTETIVDGIKYVPYSGVIQTNNMRSDSVAFSLVDGGLPGGMSLKSNGELYGIPTAAGTYTFTVQATYTGSAYTEELKDSKEFTLLIKDNTDENVEAANSGAQGYALLDAVDRQLNVSQLTDSKVFRSVGTYSDFIAFYLDGEKLVEGTDFVSEEGSTKITIRAQTFKNAGNGQHTIAAEFRAGKASNGEMKRTAQNVTVSGASNQNSSSSGGSGSGTFSISVAPMLGGKVTVSPTVAKAGASVTVKVIPDLGYELLTITAGNAKLTKVDENTYTFLMPAGKVEVKASFGRIQNGDLPFVDVSRYAYYYDAILWAVENDVTQGKDATQFSPAGVSTRAHVISFLWRAAGCPEATVRANFKDVAEDAYYSKAIDWANEKGITAFFTSSGYFNPDKACTRAEVVMLLARFAGATGKETGNAFTDVAQSDYFASAVTWAKDNGVARGVSDIRFAPYLPCTRAQAMTFLYRWAVK